MSEIVEVNGVEVEVTETDDGYEAEEVPPQTVAKFTDDYDDIITVPLDDGFVVEPLDDDANEGGNTHVVGVFNKVAPTHRSAGNLVDDDRVSYGYYFENMRITEE